MGAGCITRTRPGHSPHGITEDRLFRDLPGFKAGKSSLRPTCRAELTDVAGRSLLHLQCHFGLDTLSWARKGAIVTGVDFSDRSIALAQSLSSELGIPATFVCSDVEHLPDRLRGQFEIVFSSYGVLPWLRDLRRWGEIIADFLKSGGIFYLVDDHPLMRTLQTNEAGELTVANPYFFSEEPSRIEARGSYAAAGMRRRRCGSGIFGTTAWGDSWGAARRRPADRVPARVSLCHAGQICGHAAQRRWYMALQQAA